MAISDRIAVMDGGVIQQMGRPRDLTSGRKTCSWPPSSAAPNVLDAKLECAGGKGTLTFTDGHAVQLDNIAPGGRQPGGEGVGAAGGVRHPAGRTPPPA